MEKRVLVLGGSYFIGKKIATVLNGYGYDVTILNRGTVAVPEEGIKQLICDRSDIIQMKEVLKDRDFDYVVDVSWEDMSWVEILCDSLPFDSVKDFVFISSSSVYDVENLSIPYKEEDKLSENKYWTSYGKGKIDAEEYYSEFLKTKDTNLIILRPPYVYGEDNNSQRESLLFKLISEKSRVIIPESNPKLQFIYSGDLANIIHEFFQRKNEKIEIHNVGNKEAVTAREWVQACADIMNASVDIVEYDYLSVNRKVRDFFPFFDYDNVLDVTKINTIVSEEVPFKVGLLKAYQWFEKNKEQIAFKPDVNKNIYEIIAQLNY